MTRRKSPRTNPPSAFGAQVVIYTRTPREPQNDNERNIEPVQSPASSSSPFLTKLNVDIRFHIYAYLAADKECEIIITPGQQHYTGDDFDALSETCRDINAEMKEWIKKNPNWLKSRGFKFSLHYWGFMDCRSYAKIPNHYDAMINLVETPQSKMNMESVRCLSLHMHPTSFTQLSDILVHTLCYGHLEHHRRSDTVVQDFTGLETLELVFDFGKRKEVAHTQLNMESYLACMFKALC